MGGPDGGYIRVEGPSWCAPDVHNRVTVWSRTPQKDGFRPYEAPKKAPSGRRLTVLMDFDVFSMVFMGS